MAEERTVKKHEPKPRPRTDLNHSRYEGIEWCAHGINKDFCSTCKEATIKATAAKAAKLQAKKAKTAKVKAPAPEPEEEIEVRVEA